MKKLSLLLVVAGVAYAADNALPLSEGIIAMGDKVIQVAWQRANEKAKEPLTGSVSELYKHLREEGYEGLMQKNPEAVAYAAELVSLLTDEESANNDVKAAVLAFRVAQQLPEDVDVATRLQAWQNELKAYSVALINILQKETPEDLVIHPLTTERILLNNGKIFAEEDLVSVKAGSLAVLAGFERRKNAMGDELFKQFCDAQLLDSPAHHAIASISASESR